MSSSNPSLENLAISHDTVRLDNCMEQLKEILGDEEPRDKLVQVILAADYDLCRAIHYFYTKCQNDGNDVE